MLETHRLVIPWPPSDGRDSGAQRDIAYLRQREWLVTNGLGGYGSGTLVGMPTRKHHGLFVPNLDTPKGRHVLISRCDEVLLSGTQRWELGGAEFPGDEVRNHTHLHIEEFSLEHRIACWRIRCGPLLLERAIVMPHNQNTVCVRYRLLEGDTVQLQIRPFLSFRRHDDSPDTSIDAPYVLTIIEGQHEVTHPDCPITLRMTLRPHPDTFVSEPRRENEFLFRVEQERGYYALANAYSPGYFVALLRGHEPVTFMASTHTWATLAPDGALAFDAETRRARSLLSRAQTGDEPFVNQLVLAADQFIVLPGSRTDESALAQAEGLDLRTVIAGYHWFGDWGRDTMISLEGLTLSTGRYREAGAILRTFASYVRHGLLPNLFPEGERQALYHTVDATLWYFHAIARYLAVTGDRSLLRQLFPVLRSIVEHHLAGTDFGIHVDTDGLLTASAPGYQLTWMDAKVDGWVVTPRRGKPVEIQALWYNALCHMAQWRHELAWPENVDYAAHAHQARDAFNQRYWNVERQCLFDVIDGPELREDAAVRPNQIFALSLDHPVLVRSHWDSVLETVTRELLTPRGLRTLSRDHPDYKAHYRGALRERDAAYHQGTVWPWLIGHFIDAYLKVHADPAGARRLLADFMDHLSQAGVGSISEVFDAEPPYEPGGCIAQAWSVAEVLRAWRKTQTPIETHPAATAQLGVPEGR
ncbi:MAG TPA: amylo-alpha-1,6-glucosidase [Steroidobacteraceae bacterium]|jgi:predicted glycogen debranching enzyme